MKYIKHFFEFGFLNTLHYFCQCYCVRNMKKQTPRITWKYNAMSYLEFKLRAICADYNRMRKETL
jgi:hypothetical protein